jgi:hypothetical protein
MKQTYTVAQSISVQTDLTFDHHSQKDAQHLRPGDTLTFDPQWEEAILSHVETQTIELSRQAVKLFEERGWLVREDELQIGPHEGLLG